MSDFKIIEREEQNREFPSISRYNILDILKSNTGEEFLESWKKIEIPESEEDKFHEVQSGEKNRIDLIAHRYYDNSQLWWVIAIANNIKNPLYIDTGDILRIPSLDTLYGYGGVLS